MTPTNVEFRRLTPAEKTMAEKTWDHEHFIPTGDYWICTFDIDGQKHYAGIISGRREDVSDDTEQFQVNLRVKDEAFDADDFIPESQVAEITAAVGAEFEKGQYWKIP